MRQSQYAELRLRVCKELKDTLVDLAKANGISVNQAGNMLVNQALNKQPNLLDAMREAIKLRSLEINLMPFYHKVFDSYSLLKSTNPDSKSYLEKCQSFKESADLFVGELGRQ